MKHWKWQNDVCNKTIPNVANLLSLNEISVSANNARVTCHSFCQRGWQHPQYCHGTSVHVSKIQPWFCHRNYVPFLNPPKTKEQKKGEKTCDTCNKSNSTAREAGSERYFLRRSFVLNQRDLTDREARGRNESSQLTEGWRWQEKGRMRRKVHIPWRSLISLEKSLPSSSPQERRKNKIQSDLLLFLLPTSYSFFSPSCVYMHSLMTMYQQPLGRCRSGWLLLPARIYNSSSSRFCLPHSFSSFDPPFFPLLPERCLCLSLNDPLGYVICCVQRQSSSSCIMQHRGIYLLWRETYTFTKWWRQSSKERTKKNRNPASSRKQKGSEMSTGKRQSITLLITRLLPPSSDHRALVLRMMPVLFLFMTSFSCYSLSRLTSLKPWQSMHKRKQSQQDVTSVTGTIWGRERT